LLLVGMASAIAILAVALAFLLGRQSAVPAAAEQANAASAARTAPANQMTTAAAASDPDDAASRWLAGGWAEESTNCQTDGGDYYDPSGRYGRSGAEGLWRIEGGQLVVTITHEAVGDPLAEEYIGLPDPETRRSRIARQGPDRMVQTIDGRPVRMMRCPSAHHRFAT
jgi:hypothetical protein